MLGVTPEMAFFFYSFFKLSIFCRSDEKFDGVCQQLHNEHKLRGIRLAFDCVQQRAKRQGERSPASSLPMRLGQGGKADTTPRTKASFGVNFLPSQKNPRLHIATAARSCYNQHTNKCSIIGGR